MPSISNKPVVKKLGLKDEHRAVFLHLPSGMRKTLGALPPGLRLGKTLSGDLDFVLGFYEDAKSLRADLKKIARCLVGKGMAWVCWRKGGVTELSRDTIWPDAEKAGLETVSSISVDDDWSALKLMFPKDQRI